ncbi:MAG: glycosyltransferase family 2 protein, partial [Pseudomonadota bacterium]|nr:glycosyltransferase family 2 protein [Pseudomonadota bacterium]
MTRTDRHATPSVSCVVPAFNEARALPALLEQLREFLGDHFTSWEIVVVDDGSSDDTAAVLARHEGVVRQVALSRNFGKEAALTAGLDRAFGDVVILLDADLQHPPTLILEMLSAWRAGADMVYAVRASRADESWLKRAGARWFYRVVNVGSRAPIPADAGDFRLLDRQVVEALRRLPERTRFMKGLYAWVGFTSVPIEYAPRPRASGQSSFTNRNLLQLGVTGLTAFTTVPLRLWSALGALIALGAFFGGVGIVIDHYTSTSPVAG